MHWYRGVWHRSKQIAQRYFKRSSSCRSQTVAVQTFTAHRHRLTTCDGTERATYCGW